MHQLPEVASKENVPRAPTFKFYKAGQMLETLIGADAQLATVENFTNQNSTASVKASPLLILRCTPN